MKKRIFFQNWISDTWLHFRLDISYYKILKKFPQIPSFKKCMMYLKYWFLTSPKNILDFYTFFFFLFLVYIVRLTFVKNMKDFSHVSQGLRLVVDI